MLDFPLDKASVEFLNDPKILFIENSKKIEGLKIYNIF
jgi:hypothetical protein